MKLKNILFVVNDIENSKAFYMDLFGLQIVADFGENVILTEGLVLQEKKLWEKFIGKKVSEGGNNAELYFVENNLDKFLENMEKYSQTIEYLNHCSEDDRGRRVLRIYDPDKHLIEIGESMDYVARRFLMAGMTTEQVAKKTKLPLPQIEIMAQNNGN